MILSLEMAVAVNPFTMVRNSRTNEPDCNFHMIPGVSCPWEIVERIAIHRNFSSRFKLHHSVMENMSSLEKW